MLPLLVYQVFREKNDDSRENWEYSTDRQAAGRYSSSGLPRRPTWRMFSLQFIVKILFQLFGSLYNGFGTTTSDADICFRFASDTPPEVTCFCLKLFWVQGVNVEETLCVVSRTLKKMYGSKIFIMNIMQAKVPIVKFNLKGETNKEPIFDGEWAPMCFSQSAFFSISYYNSLALANTRMLYEYTKWDSRVAELGVWVKTVRTFPFFIQWFFSGPTRCSSTTRRRVRCPRILTSLWRYTTSRNWTPLFFPVFRR